MTAAVRNKIEWNSDRCRMPMEPDPELVAVANRILQERGYLVVGCCYRKHSLNEIIPHTDGGDLPGPLVVVGYTDYREFRQQHRDYALSEVPTPGPEEFVGFVKVVAE